MSRVYILSGGGSSSDWVRNIQRDPAVKIRIGQRALKGTGRLVQDPAEEREARRLVVAKYYGRAEVNSTGWEATSLPVAIDLDL